jgi:hypothetical protein
MQTEARVVGTRLGEDCALNGSPGIDGKIVRSAIEAMVG